MVMTKWIELAYPTVDRNGNKLTPEIISEALLNFAKEKSIYQARGEQYPGAPIVETLDHPDEKGNIVQSFRAIGRIVDLQKRGESMWGLMQDSNYGEIENLLQAGTVPAGHWSMGLVKENDKDGYYLDHVALLSRKEPAIPALHSEPAVQTEGILNYSKSTKEAITLFMSKENKVLLEKIQAHLKGMGFEKKLKDVISAGEGCPAAVKKLADKLVEKGYAEEYAYAVAWSQYDANNLAKETKENAMDLIEATKKLEEADAKILQLSKENDASKVAILELSKKSEDSTKLNESLLKENAELKSQLRTNTIKTSVDELERDKHLLPDKKDAMVKLLCSVSDEHAKQIIEMQKSYTVVPEFKDGVKKGSPDAKTINASKASPGTTTKEAKAEARKKLTEEFPNQFKDNKEK